MVKLKIIGTYSIYPTQESIVQAAQFHHYEWLIDENGHYKDNIVWEDFKDLTLIEVLIKGKVSTNFVSTIRQEDQAPYLEYFTDRTGNKILSEKDALATNKFRLCFFLYFTDISKPIEINGEEFSLVPFSDLPERLKLFTHFIPAN